MTRGAQDTSTSYRRFSAQTEASADVPTRSLLSRRRRPPSARLFIKVSVICLLRIAKMGFPDPLTAVSGYDPEYNSSVDFNTQIFPAYFALLWKKTVKEITLLLTILVSRLYYGFCERHTVICLPAIKKDRDFNIKTDVNFTCNDWFNVLFVFCSTLVLREYFLFPFIYFVLNKDLIFVM